MSWLPSLASPQCVLAVRLPEEPSYPMTFPPFDDRLEDDPHNRCGGYLSPSWLMQEERDLQADETERSEERSLSPWVQAGLLARTSLSATGRPI